MEARTFRHRPGRDLRQTENSAAQEALCAITGTDRPEVSSPADTVYVMLSGDVPERMAEFPAVRLVPTFGGSVWERQAEMPADAIRKAALDVRAAVTTNHVRAGVPKNRARELGRQAGERVESMLAVRAPGRRLYRIVADDATADCWGAFCTLRDRGQVCAEPFIFESRPDSKTKGVLPPAPKDAKPEVRRAAAARRYGPAPVGLSRGPRALSREELACAFKPGERDLYAGEAPAAPGDHDGHVREWAFHVARFYPVPVRPVIDTSSGHRETLDRLYGANASLPHRANG